MEPMAGIEPATDGLRNRCSTTELHWPPKSLPKMNDTSTTGKLDLTRPCPAGVRAHLMPASVGLSGATSQCCV